MTELTKTILSSQKKPFETVVKNNLHFWLRNFSWQHEPNVTALITEKENLIRAIRAGLRYKSTYSMAVHLLFVSTDTMLQIGIRRPWVQLTQTALKNCPQHDEYTRGRLLLCQAKQMLLAERFVHVEKLLTEVAESARKNCDADLQWEVSYYHGISCVRTGKYDIANQCVDAVAELLKYCTLLNTDLCQGRIAMLGGEIAIATDNWDKAEFWLNIAVNHLKEEGATHATALALDMLGQCHLQKGDLKVALSLWDDAMELIPKGFDFQTRSKLIIKSAELHLQTGKIGIAEQRLQLLDFNRMRLSGSLDIHLEAVLLLSEIAQQKGEHEQAALIRENAQILQKELESQTTS